MRAVLLTSVISVIPLTYAANHVHSTVNLRHRRQSVPSQLPGTWTSLGCYTDAVAARTLTGGGFASGNSMTIEACISFCESNHFIYAGTEYSAECYCGNVLQNGGAHTADTDCNMPCSGNSLELCGSGGRLNLFWNGEQPPPPPTITPQIGNWTSLGCYSDNVNGGRSLTVGMNVDGSMTNAKCTSACFHSGYGLAGTEYAGECYCGHAIANGGSPTPAGDCNMVCAGNSSEFCGGPNRLNVYNYTGTDLPTSPPNGGTGGNGGSLVFPVLDGLPSPWAYNACWVDNAFGRIMPVGIPANQQNTIQTCIGACQAQNYTLAGTEFGVECYCGNTLIEGAVLANEADCNMGCAGNTTQACGGPNRMSVYTSTGNVTALPPPTTLNASLPEGWSYSGCLKEPDGGKVFPWKLFWPKNNTIQNCIQQCGAFGYPAAGAEFGEECWCGDITDINANGGTLAPEGDCNFPCSGDPIHFCGGAARMSLYTFAGAMNVWHAPAVTGRYEFFVPGVVVPLIATVGVNDKVTFLEKTGTGFPNSTGAYELDLSLAHNFSAAWREMHLKTDVFCSGSLILPDKAGRQINVGGWSLESTYGIRFYTPDGVPGTNSTNDWEENYDELHLQRGRWYPTAAMLPNGTILVMGGEKGSNDVPEPSLEILPKPAGGDTVIDLEWLRRTDPNNLYPFIIVLPSGNIFVAYYNEARILDPVTFNTIKELPNMPAAVDDFLGGRTYPLEGAAMPFPLSAPYTDPMRVLVCGGSTIGAGKALDNCVSIEPEVENATWTLERMPSKRVMPCMANLPDGTYLIVNGAHQGVAGFGLATNPNLNAVLYDPSQPVNQRFSILNNTIVARMYHSEAILLPDARVLISGSDPQTAMPDGTPIYPEEFRIEVYVPPYLSQGFRQPEFNLTNHDWAYGGTYTINNIKLYQGTTATMRVSLIGAVSSTHGNAMAARTVFPAFSCSGTSCVITAPPNANISPPGWHQLFILDGPTPSHSQWVRIGGDPAQLGLWPNLPGFTPPGI
ncbi:copper radical oxidase [Amanita thiersii Skay4041]|uniref:Copper radical oxidase n=1 Tax=Amanita thiersii Skay4041 TaxID=703135 RepID=A0A2A9NZX5_9AGAR|nr:copper radical oxidase [Amanita thiersii Skay4041]